MALPEGLHALPLWARAGLRGVGLEARATIDFETRSACNLKKAGSWRYSLDLSTEVLCLAWRLPEWGEGETALWYPAFPHLGLTGRAEFIEQLWHWIQQGGLVEAHNAWFERGIWQNIMVGQLGWPSVGMHQWRCSAAKAAAHALPRSLDGASTALGLARRKDAAGHALMLKLCKPRKPRKAEREAGATGPFWHESREDFERLFAYCRQDVLTEEAVSAALPDLSPEETALYTLDQAINERGFQLDHGAVKQALALVSAETADINQQIKELTGGYATKGTQRQRMLDWLAEEGCELTDTQARTVDARLAGTLPDRARRGLSLLRELGRSSTAKYTTMQHWACPDGRVRGGLLYHGATTGRWSGLGVQPHNFIRGTLKVSQEQLWRALATGDREALRAEYGSVMLVLSEALRGAICAPEGSQLYVADYSQIEARVLLWLAGDTENLDIIARGDDIYLVMARDIGPNAPRQLGKAAVLGCGFQMGWAKFRSTAAIYGADIDDAMAKRTVDAYRARFWRVKELWTSTEFAAQVGERGWVWEDRFLYATLASGRRLAYPFPEIQTRQMPWGEKESLTFMGVNPVTRQWERQHTYGGKLVENLVQATARDLMAEAMLRLEATGVYRPVLSIHDELVCEAETGSVEEMVGLMTTNPVWAVGLPIAAEGWQGTRYHK